MPTLGPAGLSGTPLVFTPALQSLGSLWADPASVIQAGIPSDTLMGQQPSLLLGLRGTEAGWAVFQGVCVNVEGRAMTSQPTRGSPHPVM